MNKDKTNLTIDDVFQQLQVLDQAESIQDDDLTIKRVMAKFPGWGARKARTHLETLASRGVLRLLPTNGAKGPGSKMMWRISAKEQA